MVHAFIMVKTAAGKSADLLDAIRGLANATEAHIVAGEYDIVVEVDASEIYDVLHLSSSDIQDLGGVLETRTYISLD